MASVSEKPSILEANLEFLEKLPVIKNYYLIIGGGKIGTSFLRYAQKMKVPFILVIDKDQDVPASKDAKVLNTESQLITLLENKTNNSLQEETVKPEIYFYKMDICEIPFLLSFGIPEYIIPAVPYHVAAYILPALLSFPFKEVSKRGRTSEIKPQISGRSIIRELVIEPDDFELMDFFENIVRELPENILAGQNPEQGMLFLSYARTDEICPDGCPGPRMHCPTFEREKPQTVTEYVRKLTKNLHGWVFESYQMKPGIGGLKGADLKQNLLEILEFLKSYKSENVGGSKAYNNFYAEFKGRGLSKKFFFIATTCTCHGVLNLFFIIEEPANCLN
jgi:hypothetical protein